MRVVVLFVLILAVVTFGTQPVGGQLATQSDRPGVKPGPGVLAIAVRALPTLLSPDTAQSDPDHWALDLVYEGLLKRTRSDAGTCLEPGLAAGMPHVEVAGRSFVLDPEARWSDGSSLTANDILATIDRLRAAGRANDLGDTQTHSPRRLQITLRLAHPDPASLFTFKVARLGSGKTPTGSGPYRFTGVTTEGGRAYADFRPNSYFAKAAGRDGLPQLTQIRFVAGTDPVADVRAGIADMALESRTPLLNPESVGRGEKPRLETGIGSGARVFTLPSRRIHYLAFNPIKMAFGGDAGRAMRRAIAFGINREAVLDSVWRVAGVPAHRPLTGPFPPGSWPCDPETPALDDAALARAELRSAKAADQPLVLSFRSDEADAGQACARLCEQLSAIGIAVVPRGLDAKSFARTVEAEKDYDLCYQHFDFADEWFDPRPLLAINGMGPGPWSARLEAALAACTTRNEFGPRRDAHRQLHRKCREAMPFVPLWSLDVHIVISKVVEAYPTGQRLDPLFPLADIERWRVNR